MNNNICVVGAGYWGKNHIKTLDQLSVLAGIVESDSTLLSSLINDFPDVKFYDNVSLALKDDYDGFTIATPASRAITRPVYSILHLLSFHFSAVPPRVPFGAYYVVSTNQAHTCPPDCPRNQPPWSE